MSVNNKQEAEKIASRYLSDLSVGSKKIEVDVSADRQEGTYWYVLVKPRQSISDTMRYYELLSKVETRILQETGEEILLVPVAA